MGGLLILGDWNTIYTVRTTNMQTKCEVALM